MLGTHLVKSGYGLWLPGESRGHWSTAWDAQIGYIEPRTLHPGDPIRLRMAEERMTHPPVQWSAAMQQAITQALIQCAAQSPWDIAALAIEPTHIHLLMTASRLDVDRTCKWLAQMMSKAVHRDTDHTGPVFAKGNWRTFIFDEDHWHRTLAYIRRHPGVIHTLPQSRGWYPRSGK